MSMHVAFYSPPSLSTVYETGGCGGWSEDTKQGLIWRGEDKRILPQEYTKSFIHFSILKLCARICVVPLTVNGLNYIYAFVTYLILVTKAKIDSLPYTLIASNIEK